MDYEKMGICVSIAVMVAVLGIAGTLSGEFDLGVDEIKDEIKLPDINAGTNTNDGYWQYCYKLGIENC